MEWNGRRDWREEKKRQVWCRPLGLSPSFLYSGVPPPARCWRSAAALRANSKSKQQHLPRSLSRLHLAPHTYTRTRIHTRGACREGCCALFSLLLIILLCRRSLLHRNHTRAARLSSPSSAATLGLLACCLLVALSFPSVRPLLRHTSLVALALAARLTHVRTSERASARLLAHAATNVARVIDSTSKRTSERTALINRPIVRSIALTRSSHVSD